MERQIQVQSTAEVLDISKITSITLSKWCLVSIGILPWKYMLFFVEEWPHLSSRESGNSVFCSPKLSSHAAESSRQQLQMESRSCSGSYSTNLHFSILFWWASNYHHAQFCCLPNFLTPSLLNVDCLINLTFRVIDPAIVGNLWWRQDRWGSYNNLAAYSILR